MGHPERRVGGLGHQGPAVTKWGQTEGRFGFDKKVVPSLCLSAHESKLPPRACGQKGTEVYQMITVYQNWLCTSETPFYIKPSL